MKSGQRSRAGPSCGENRPSAATGLRCASGSRSPSVDLVQPLQMVKLSGTVKRQDGAPVTGRALYITAFDAAEIDPRTGMPAPGRSPAAEVRVNPSGGAVQQFELPVPRALAHQDVLVGDDLAGYHRAHTVNDDGFRSARGKV